MENNLVSGPYEIKPDNVRSALRILQKINEHYKGITIDDKEYDYFCCDELVLDKTFASP
ncbi:unnamed protein product, partial [Didymodactylos carnosus]